jgi:hypothetical protein
LTVTISRIHEIIALKYFTHKDAHVPREETVPELGDDEVVVFEEFFYSGAPNASALYHR